MYDPMHPHEFHSHVHAGALEDQIAEIADFLHQMDEELRKLHEENEQMVASYHREHEKVEQEYH